MVSSLLAREERAHPAFFWLGAAAVTAGVALHLPMFIDAAAMTYHLAGMPVDGPMLLGMTLIVAGTASSWYGLLPVKPRRAAPAGRAFDPSTSSGGSGQGFSRALVEGSAAALPAELGAASPPSHSRADGRLAWAHWQLMLVLALGLVIDSMKPASLGFTVPGLSEEYGLPREIVALLPFCALSGLTLGSYVWGVIGDQVGRRAAILLSGIMFVGTAICGAMPGFIWNLVMCFFMGLAAGGMLPITYALLAECMPTRHRGWVLVLLGGLGLIGGYFAASGAAALLEPHFGWRILWFLNAPTGVILILCNPFIPESPRFLLMRGRIEEARRLVRRFAVQTDLSRWVGAPSPPLGADSTAALLRRPFRGTTATLNLAGLAWGVVNFGLLLWVPAELRRRGYGVAGSDVLLFRSALMALPTIFAVAWLYSAWSTKWTLFLLTVLTALGLLGLSLIDSGIAMIHDNPIVLFSILMIGVNGIIAVLLPYSAENYPVLVRGRGTGLVAGSSKLGGLAAQAVTVAALVPGLGAASMALALPVAVSAGMVARYGKETRNRRLEDFDR